MTFPDRDGPKVHRVRLLASFCVCVFVEVHVDASKPSDGGDVYNHIHCDIDPPYFVKLD